MLKSVLNNILDVFTKLYYQIKNDKIDEKFVDDIYSQDLVFKDIDYKIYK